MKGHIMLPINFTLSLFELNFILKKDKKIPINFPLLFTNSHSLEFIYNIAKAIAKHYGQPVNGVMALFLRGYWQGFFERGKTICPLRLGLLQSMHDIPSLKESFIFTYEGTEQPSTVSS
jgi:hypothetical protein